MALTNKDLDKIDEKINKRFDEKFAAVRDDIIDAVDNALAKQRSDFLEDIDPILKEVQASREERDIVSHRISDHEDRIEKLEKAVAS